MTNDEAYEQEIMAILRANNMRPPELSRQYKRYKDTRDLFEQGYTTLEDLEATVTPVVVAMLDLESRMLTDMHADAAVEQAEPTGHPLAVVAYLTIMNVLRMVFCTVLALFIIEGVLMVIAGG